MALAAVQTAMNHEGNQSLHPFFSKPPPTNETLANHVNDDPDYEHDPTNAQPEKTRKKRTRKTEHVKEKKGASLHTQNQASLDRFTRPAQAQLFDQAANEDAAEPTLEEDLNVDRKKRRKTASPEPVDASTPIMPGLDWHQQLQVEAHKPIVQEPLATAEATGGNSEALLRAASPVPATTFLETLPTVEESGAVENKAEIVTPKKQIRVTKSGRLVSSPPKPHLQETTPPKKKRGRKPGKAKQASTVTIIRYGSDASSRYAIGGRIDAIMAGIRSNGNESATTKRGPAKPAEPAKSTHPFFLGKAAQKTEEVPANPVTNTLPSTPRRSAVTPGKLRAEARRDGSPDNIPAFGTSARTNKGSKQSGLLEACWPTKETNHVRNLDVTGAHPMQVDMTRALPLRARKLKHRVVTLGEREEVISRLARDLAPDMRTKSDGLDFNPPEDVRLPTRLLTTGDEIQRRVQGRLQSQLGGNSYDQGRIPSHVHPAVELLFNEIEHTLTPFDEGRCEGQAWAQKYSPKCASHVLSESKDATVLRDWLQSLTVLAVGGAQGTAKADPADVKRPPKKKRKKAVDDFIVSDDEEEDEEMIAVSDREDAQFPRSFRRPRWTRSNNVILLSGPHGCGKSATVYAVAKELDFEVFEMNSGSRRSGKDIQDRVGDMTANHLVNHKREAAPQQEALQANDNDTDSERIDTACQQDIDSGRQGTMMNFFKTNPATKVNPKPKPKPQKPRPAAVTAVQSSLTKLNGPPKSQKQSLILFEEADILFEEDQQFWAHVTKLAANSKRPIVITCNDERQIPLHDLPLAAVLRLHPAPVDLATDYLLVLAGREGHILERQAVTDLYKSKKHDLRGSIAELNFWCQISVGDRKGGLEWMYQRWPPGKDVDADGRLLRVASEGTYQPGMGWLSHNVFETTGSAAFDKEEELLNEVWADWGIDPTTWAGSSDPNLCIQSTSLRDLKRMDMHAETLSAADVYCRVDLPSYAREHDQPADATLPPIFDKSRLSYTLAAPLLQADQQSDFLQFDTSIYTQTQLLARRTFPELTSPLTIPAGEQPLVEADCSKAILGITEAKNKERPLSRFNFSWAFDVLAAPPDQTLPERTSFILTPSSFDRTFSITTLDLAPYVRSIVAHEQILELQRIRMSNLLSVGGTGKRARTTRASRVALEGGVRESKRRDRWFEAEVDFGLVMATAGKNWTGMGWRNEAEEMGEGSQSVTGTQESLAGSQDVTMHGVEEEPQHMMT
jgi:DNA polymerase III delta prime subunit